MYAISDEDSFLPAILTGNPTKQLEQVRGYYERQRELSLVFDRNLDEIRMAYCRKLCKEKERLSKSLWELEVKKRRLLHQIAQPRHNSDWRWKSVSETAKKERLRLKAREDSKNSKFETGKTRLDEENGGISSKRGGKRQGKPSKHKSKTKPSVLEESEQLPKYLLY